jgi:hypothetical protein
MMSILAGSRVLYPEPWDVLVRSALSCREQLKANCICIWQTCREFKSAHALHSFDPSQLPASCGGISCGHLKDVA